MEPISDVACADWLRPLVDRSARDMHCVVPHGYQAYARVFHPATRDRPADTGTWRGHSRPTAAEIDVEPVSWSRVAEAFGTSMHPLAQFHRLIRPQSADYREVIDAAGWRYGAPHPGNLDVRVLARLASIMCRHTASPHSGIAAVWEGWGGLTSPARLQPTNPCRRRQHLHCAVFRDRRRVGIAARRRSERTPARAARKSAFPILRSSDSVRQPRLGLHRTVDT